MRYLISLALLLQLFLPARAAQDPIVSTQEQTGNDFLRDCTNALRLLDGDLKLTADESGAATYCGGYLVGFYEGYEAKAVADKVQGDTPHREVCLPENLPTDQMVRIVVKYLREHPERLQQGRNLLVVGAFYGAFPCK